jgi:pSer/pThr/pTyr-binding forkhead associated (FHA) protein
MEHRAILRFLNGDFKGQSFKLRRDATILGRDKGDVVVIDTEVSSSHCQIQEIAGTFYIFDMNSTNGTFVNNQRVIKSALSTGDMITLGKTSLVFELKKENEVRNIATMFKPAKEDERPQTIVETLIDSQSSVHEQQRKLILKVKYRTGFIEEITLDQKNVYIGRAVSFGQFERDSELSRKHLLIKLNNTGEVFIEDQDSTNGTFLNGQKVYGMVPVSPGDVVQIGETLLSVRVG